MQGMWGIVLALVLLMALAYRGYSVLLLAPLCALVAVLCSGDVPLLASYTQVFMPALGGFVVAFFPLFLLGAVFGRLMEASGAALAIARGLADRLGAGQAVLAVVAACAVLTYGGVSLFVVAFAVHPIAVALFMRAGHSRRLIPATIALGAFTFTMTALPGTPAIQNAIPMPFFGTTPFAAPGLGLIGAVIMLAAGWAWIEWRVRRVRDEVEPADEGAAEAAPAPLPGPAMSLGPALLPVLMVIVLNYLLSTWFWPAADTAYLAESRYGATTLQAVRGVWSVIGALGVAIVLLIGLWWHARRRLLPAQSLPLQSVLEEGARACVMPLMNTASQVGFGAVIASLAGFALIREAVMGLSAENPLVSMSIAINLLAGMTGSASGGMSIALQTLGSTWLEMAHAAGIAPELLHRVTAIATGGLDALPHNGAVITLLGICGLTHRQSYADIFMVAVVAPLLALAAVVTLGTLLGSF